MSETKTLDHVTTTTARKEHEFHPLANIFPLLPDAELKVLADDISRNGQREPITLYQGFILDGRNRYLACKRVFVEPKTVECPASALVRQN